MGFGLLVGLQRWLFCIFAFMILVTGGTGLVGGHLLYRFRESEEPIRAIYRNRDSINKTRDIFESYQAGDGRLVDGFEWVPADILDLPSLEKAMKDVTVVYHCAAALEAKSFDDLKKINVTGTQFLVDLAIYLKVEKFCYVSSIAALGSSIGNQPVTEEDFFNPDAQNTDYAISKYGGEMEVWRGSQEGLNVVIVNPGVILGEADYNSGSGQFFSKTDRSQPYYTSGSSGFSDVRDVAAIMQKLTNSKFQNQRYILVEGNHKFKEVMDLIATELGSNGPRIKISKWVLYLIYTLLKLPAALGFIKGLSRAQITSWTSKRKYSNELVRSKLNYDFIPIEKTISRVAQHYKKVS